MQEKRRKLPLNPVEVLFLAVLTPVIFFVATKLLLRPMNSYAPLWFSTPIGFFTVLGFDVLWGISMKLWPFKGVKVKIFLTSLVLALSASVLACWVILNALSDMW